MPWMSNVKSSGRRFRLWPSPVRRSVGAAIQPFGQQPEARPVIRQNLKPVAPLVKEDEQKTGRRLLLQRLFDQGVEAVEALPSIDGRQRQEHPRGRRKA
jgi:hypothetical protein